MLYFFDNVISSNHFTTNRIAKFDINIFNIVGPNIFNIMLFSILHDESRHFCVINSDYMLDQFSKIKYLWFRVI